MNAAFSLWLFVVTLSANDADKTKAPIGADPEPTLALVDKLAVAEAELKELAAKESMKYLGFTGMTYDANKRTIDLRSWNLSVHVDLSDK